MFGVRCRRGRPLCLGAFASALQRPGDIARFVAGRGLADQAHDKIARGQLVAQQPETFAYAAFHPIAINRARQQALADHQPQSRQANLVGTRQHHITICAGSLVLRKNLLEFCGSGQPRRTRPGLHACETPCAGLDRQTGATLAATRVDDGTTGLGFHAGAETVGALATNGGGLISTFHGLSFRDACPALRRDDNKNPLKNRVLDTSAPCAVKPAVAV